jgi:Fanconi-associated nuclease 1
MTEPPAKRVKLSSFPLPSPDPDAGLVDTKEVPDDHASPEAAVRGSSGTPELENVAPKQRVSMVRVSRDPYRQHYSPRRAQYVAAFEEMYDIVLQHERYLFSAVELEALDNWRTMSCSSPCQHFRIPIDATADEARYLFVRLFLRKNGWFRVSGLAYESDISNMNAACAELCETIAAPSAPVSPALSRSSSSSSSAKAKTPEIFDVDSEELLPAVDPLSGQAPGRLGVSTEASQFGVSNLEEELRHFAWNESRMSDEGAIDEIVTMLGLEELKARSSIFLELSSS